MDTLTTTSGEPTVPTYQTTEDMVLNFDGWLGSQTPDIRSGIDAHLKASGQYMDREKKRLASIFTIAEETGLPVAAVNDQWDTVRAGYAEKKGGDWLAVKDDEQRFHSRLVQHVTKRKETRIQEESFQSAAISDALKLNPSDPMEMDAKMQEAAGQVANAGPEDAAKFFQSYRRARSQAEAQAGPLRPVAREVYNLLSKGRTERFGEDVQNSIEVAIDKLAELPEAQRGIVVAMLQAEGGKDQSANTPEKTASSGVRGLVGQLRGLASNTQRNNILAIQKQIQAGEIFVPDGKAMADVFRQRAGFAAPDLLSSLIGNTRKATDEEKLALSGMTEKALIRSEVAAQAVGILEGTIDPIKTKGMFQRTAVNVGSSVGAMVPSFIPYAGLVIQQGAFADQEYQRQRAMGTDPQTANSMAQITGTVQAGLDRLQAIAALSLPLKIPAARLATSGLAGNTAARIITGVAGTQLAEYSIEAIQNGVPILTSALAEKLGWTLPEKAQYDQELSRWKVWDPEMFMTLLPLSLLGGGFQGVNNAQVARDYLGDAIGLQAVGIAPDVADKITALPESERVAAYQAAYQQRNPATQEAENAQKAVSERTRASIKAGEAVIAEIGDAGLSITRTPEGFAVTDTATGDKVNVPDALEAMTVARSIMTERGIQKEETFLDALDEFTGTMKEGRTIELSGRTGSLLQELEAAESGGQNGNVQSIWDRADDYRASVGEEALVRDSQDPDSRNALENLLVLGRSRTQVLENAARSVSVIMQGGSTLDLVEEQAENDLREAVLAGKTSTQTMRGILQRIEAATGDKYINTETDTGIAEAWSSLVRVYTTGTRKGNRITASSRSETASSIRAIRRRLREAEGNGITPSAFSKLREYYAQLKAILGQAARLMRAKAEGKLGDDVELMIRESVGLKEQDALTEAVLESTPKDYNLPDGWDTQEDVGFSITTADRLEAVAQTLAKKARDPEARLKMYETARDRLSGMARSVRYNDSGASAATATEVERQRVARKRAEVTRLYEEVDSEFGDLSGVEFVSKATNNPVIEALINPGRGKGGLPRGRLKTRVMDLPGGEYDGSDAIPRWLFGGTLTPDLAAQELYEAGLLKEPTPDALWEAIASALQTTASAKDRLAAYASRRREARETASSEADTWATEEIKKLPKRSEALKRTDMLRFLGALDTILMPFPAEVRGKVGGFVKLAGLRSNASMESYLKQRVEKLDAVLEIFMKREFTEAMERLLVKAKPTKGKPGEKIAGKLGPDVQHLMNMVEAAMKWTSDKVDAHIAGLDSSIASGNLTADEEALALREKELVQLAGNWYPRSELTGKFGVKGQALTRSVYDGLPASQMSAALKAAEETYEGGYLAWAAKLGKKREKREAIQAALTMDTGKAGSLAERNARAEKDLGWIGKTKDFFLSLSSFEEVSRYVFGKDSRAAREIVDAERNAAYAYEDGTAAMADSVQTHFTTLAKGSHLAGEKLRYRLSQKSISAGGVSLSEMEAIQALLLWNQADGQRHMIGHLDENGLPSGPWHYDQAWIDEVAGQMTAEGKATMAFIQRVYGAEWATLNPLYRERHGVNLPRNENYAPITVAPVQAKAGEMVDPVSGQAMAGSILTPGSLRTRSRSAIAEPEFRDALQTMLAHTAQMEHWKAYYDFAVEAQAVLGNREVSNAVSAAGGKQSTVVLRKWIDHFAQGGTRDAGAALAANQALSKVSGRAARMALVGRVGTLLIQSTQLGAALAEMPTGAYVSRMGKLLTGQLSWGSAIRSEYIQRRIQQMPPIVRQALAGLDTDNPNAVKHAVNRMGNLISGADGLFTAGTYAILLDYHRGEATKQGFTGPKVDAYAHDQATRSTERVAQPTRAGTRSLYENTATSPLAKLGWAFASEARQKIALAAWATSTAKSDPAHAARVALVVWGVGGLMAQVIRNSWKDVRDDDDEEVFDERNWSLKQLIAGTISGPLQGIPGLGEALQGVIAKATGTYDSSGNLLSSLGRSVPAAKSILSGDFMDSTEPVEETIKDVEAILTAAGMANDTLAATTSILHLVRDGAAILDGFRDDLEEKAGMTKRARSSGTEKKGTD